MDLEMRLSRRIIIMKKKWWRSRVSCSLRVVLRRMQERRGSR